MFQAVCDLFGYDPPRLTATERTKVGKAAKELLAAGAAVDQVALAGRAWDRLFYPDHPLFSEMGLIAHWSKLRPLIERYQRTAVRRVEERWEPPPDALPREVSTRLMDAMWKRLRGELSQEYFERLVDDVIEGGDAAERRTKPGSRAGLLP